MHAARLTFSANLWYNQYKYSVAAAFFMALPVTADRSASLTVRILSEHFTVYAYDVHECRYGKEAVN